MMRNWNTLNKTAWAEPTLRTKNTITLTLILMSFGNLILLNSGCKTNDRTKRCAIKTYSEQFSELLKSQEGSQEFQYNRIRVFYESGLDEQAQLLAPLMEELVLHVEKELSLQLNISDLTLFLFHGKGEFPLSGENIIFSGTGFKAHVTEQRALVVLLIPENANLESIVIKNPGIYSSVLFHELVEAKLTTRIQVNFSSTKYDAENMLLTRWFREGFSNYAGYISHKFLLSKINGTKQMNKTWLYNGLERHPFSNLNIIGKNLFQWHQIKGGVYDNNIDYYEAALGLFLLIENRHGPEAIAKIGKEINELNYANGKDLIALCNRVIGSDIVELVDNFYFPDLGMGAEALFPLPNECNNINVSYGIAVKRVSPGGMAQKWGIKDGDVITKVNQEDISTEFEFEFAILKLLEQQSVVMEIWRKDTGKVSLPVSLLTRTE